MELTNGTIGQVRAADIVEEMQGAYLDYAMSVIVARALPDVRDGLKPVHRRILYAMSHDLGLDHTKPHKKSARIVGEVLGKYHPHGDTAVYDAMVRMAQPFSLRYPLIDGQGNFGSVDGDAAAAMRYTEARLAEISQLMLDDLEKDTVDWHDNFDNSLREPDILPAALPNLLINGSSGIAVGMATNIPPHNLGEIVDALTYLIDHYDKVDAITVEQLMHFVQGPDFPTGGIVYRFRDEKGDDNVDVVAQGYSVGRSRLVVQAKAHFEEMSRSRSRIVVTELPYQTNKAALIERIAGLVRDGKLEGITDLRDESDRTGMRMVIELTRNVEPKDVLAELFKQTPLQQTFGLQMLALVDGEPRTLSLKRMLHLFVQHRQEIIRRRSEFDLARARARAHILEGLLRALDILDEVISAIRRSQNVETARTNLMRGFGFTEIQAQAILDMQLRRLAALERRKLQDEYKEVQGQIAFLEDLLAHPEKVLKVIRADLLAIKEKYGDARRTQIVDRTKGTLTTTDLLPDQEVWVSVGANGEVRRQDAARLGMSDLRQIGKDSEVELVCANTRDFLYLFARDGRCRRIAVHELPRAGEQKHLAELTDYSRRDEVTAALALPRIEASEAQGYLFLVTEKGMVKRVTLADFVAAAASDPVVINVEGKDRLRWVLHTAGGQEVILVSGQGQCIRFDEETVRSMGLAAGGVGGIKLKSSDRLVHAGVVDAQGELLTITAQGFAKRSTLDQYPSQGRYGGGIVTHKLTSKTGPVAGALVIGAAAPEAVVVLPRKGAVKVVPLADVPAMGRSVQGKTVVDLGDGNGVVAVKAVRTGSQVTGETPAAPVTLPQRSAPPQNGATDKGTKSGEDAAPQAPKRARMAAAPAATTTPPPAAPQPAPQPAAQPAAAQTEPVAAKPVKTASATPAAKASRPVQEERGTSATPTPRTRRAETAAAGAADGPAPSESRVTQPAPNVDGKRAAKPTAKPEAAKPEAAQEKAVKEKAATKPAPAKPNADASPTQPSLLPLEPPAPAKRPAAPRKVATVTSVKRPKK
jgi:DNA gyrase subunit A